MITSKLKKLISTMLSFTLASTIIPCSAANLVPFNGVKPIITPSVPITTSIVEQKNSSDGFSIQSIKSKIKYIVKPQKNKTKLQETYSGSCGDNVAWELDTSTGVLNISGTGNMNMYDFSDVSRIPWYSYISFIKTVTIGDGVTSIGNYAFFNCYALTSITIPDSVTSIGSEAFAFCYKLDSVTIPDTVASIGLGAFGFCIALKSISIPNSVTSMGNDAFYGCSALESISISDRVTSIGSNTFSFCSALKSLSIPNSVTSIGELAFYGCSALESISISDRVTSIGSGAFSKCSALTSIIVGANNGVYKDIDGVLFTEDEKILLQYPAGNPRISYEIPETVTSINKDAFSGCSTLNELIMPRSVTSIKVNAFFDCSALKKVTLNSNNAVSQFKNAFPNTKIEELIIGDAVTSINEKAFSNCSTLNSVTLGEEVTSVGNEAFSGCSAITSVTLNNDYTVLNFKEIFPLYSQIKEIAIGDEVTFIGDNAFSGCRSLQQLLVGINVTSFGEEAFMGCITLTNINIGPNITYIGIGAFSSCISLSSITVNPINPIYQSIDGVLFSKDGTTLKQYPIGKPSTSYEIPNSVTYIDKKAFINSHLTSLIIPNSVTSIGELAFENCILLTELNLPASVTSIEGENIFETNRNMSKINVDPNNPKYSSVDGVLYSKDETELIRCPEGKTGNFKLPNKVKLIQPHAFYFCNKLNSISLNEGLSTISKGAFYLCTGLTSIDIPSSVTNIEEDAFGSCTNIVSATLNNDYVLEKFKSILQDCSNLNTITIGENVKTIPDKTFNECSNLSSVSIGNNVESIGDSSFSDCVKLTEVTIPNKVDTIKSYAFSNCKELKKVVVEGNLKHVGERAFWDCSSLNNFTYNGTEDPGGKNVFNTKLKVSVPKNYKDDKFCELEIDKKLTAKEWFKKNSAYIGTAFGILGATATILGFALAFPGKWNKFVGNYGCGCLKRCHIPTTTADEEQSVSEIDSNVLDQQLVE